jgi:isopentenyl phosphate kinase
MKKNVVLIKLGGSVITNKETIKTVRKKALARLVQEIARAKKETNDIYIIGHGQGSFAHFPALKYKTKDGFVSDDSVMGMAITQDNAAQLNRIVVNEFISANIPAASFLFSNSMVTASKEAKHWRGQVLLEYLKKGITPITGGDVIVDENIGCTIWSTEKVLHFIAMNMPEQYFIKKVVNVAEVPGVLDQNKKIISSINETNKNQVKKLIHSTKGFDVTGGMWHKIEESLELAGNGIDSYIISGVKQNTLYNCLIGADFEGTKISRSNEVEEFNFIPNVKYA